MASKFELAEAYTEFTIHDAQFQSGLKSVRASLDRTTARLRAMSLAAKVALAAAGGAMVAFVKEAATAEETVSKFNAVFKEQAEVTRQWADGFAQDVGRSRYAIQGFLATLQDTFVPLGFARDEAANMSQTLLALGVDLASFNNAAEPETINLLTSALVGNHEAVRRFGIIITQATLDQELLNMGIAGGVRQATEQEKVLARMNLILKSTSDAQGDAKRTSGSLTNQMRALKAAYIDVAVEAGNALIPTIRDAITWLNTKKEVITRVILATVEAVKQYGLFTLKIYAGIKAVQAMIKVIRALADMYRIAAKSQAVLYALSGPKGWAAIAAGALAAAAAIETVDRAYAGIADSAERAMRAASAANKETAKATPPGFKRGELLIDTARQALASGDLAAARKANTTLAHVFSDMQDKTTDHYRYLRSTYEDIRAEIEAAEGARKDAAKKEEDVAVGKVKVPQEQRQVRPMQPPSLALGSIGLEQLQTTLQSNRAAMEREKIRYARDTARTLADLQSQGITIRNPDALAARFN